MARTTVPPTALARLAAPALAAALLAAPVPAAAAGAGVVDGHGQRYVLAAGLDGATGVVTDYGRRDDRVVVGDWDGRGGDTLGVRRGNTFHLANDFSGSADLVTAYGRAGDEVVVGDWDGDGRDTLGVRRGNTFHLDDDLDGAADTVTAYGREGDEVVIGDWDGDGVDTPGVRRGSTFHLANDFSGAADVVTAYGRAGDEVHVGDWDGDGADTLGVRRGTTFHLHDAFTGGTATHALSFGGARDRGFTGDWDGDGRDTPGVREFPAFAATVRTVTAAELGASWRPGCPVGPERLRAVELDHVDFAGVPHRGTIVVAAAETGAVTSVFATLYEAGVPIGSVRPVAEFGGDDDASMAANNSSGFNCRRVAGTSVWSEHAYGAAIDINPVQNPWVAGSSVDPAAGRAYLNRADVRPGMVVAGDVTVRAFADAGWHWGGAWSRTKDYQHFSRTGR